MVSTPSLPPGPRPTPWGLYQVIHEPGPLIAEQIRRYGDPFTERFVGFSTVFSCNPEAARRLLTADPDLFEVPNPDQLVPLLGKDSVLFLIGARHRAERKLLNPHFHGGRMRAYGQLIREITRRQLAAWRVSDRFRMLDTTQAISLEVILGAVFGVDSDRLNDFRTAVLDFVNAFTAPLVFVKRLRRPLFGVGPWDRFVQARQKLDRMIDDEVARRKPATDDRQRQDILSLLVSARYEDGSAMTREQIRDELVSLLFAGHETTAVSLAWTLYHLHRQPATLERVRGEVTALGSEPDLEEIVQLPYLTAVCKESLRLHPVVPILPPRQVREPFEFLGYTLPPKTLVSIGTIAMHRREDLYPAPDSFNPERFLSRTYSPFEYLPFGGGTRRCIGAEFAMYEMKIVLATMLTECRLSLATQEPVRQRRRGLVLGPAGGVPMLLTGRV